MWRQTALKKKKENDVHIYKYWSFDKSEKCIIVEFIEQGKIHCQVLEVIYSKVEDFHSNIFRFEIIPICVIK